MSTNIAHEKKRRLNALEEDYRAASRRLENEIDPVHRGRLGAQLRSLEAEIQSLEEDLSGAPSPDAAFEAQYRRLIAAQLDYLELFGVNDRHQERYPLTPAYVRLSAGTSGTERRECVEDLLGQDTRWVIRGEAGSGKTTLLRWLAVRAAQHELPPGLAAWGAPIPFFLRLRNCVRLEEGKALLSLPPPEQWIPEFASSISGTMPEQWMHRQLAAGRVLLLVDGVDEVSSELQFQVREWLEGLQTAYTSCTFVVSSRPQLPEGWLPGYRECQIARLGLSEAWTLIDLWHTAITKQVTEDERGQLPHLAARLRRALGESTALRSLVESPLLGAMICALHRRNPNLPGNRLAVYTTCCDAFLLRSDPAGITALRPALRWINDDHIRRLLNELACWMVLNSMPEPVLEEVDGCLERTLANIPGRHPDTNPVEVRQHLIERVALIHQPESRVVSFVHKTFMEYFAARELVRANHIRLLVQHADDPGWEEVIRLSAGRTNREQSRELISGILNAGLISRPERRERRRLLALACLETCVDLDPDMQDQVRKEIRKLLPPRSAAAARSLGLAGPLAVPFLRPDVSWSDESLRLAVQALGRIGGDSALEMLGEYAALAGSRIFDALDAERERFQQGDYLRRVLARVERPEGRWAPQGLTSLEGVSWLGWLTTLDLSASPELIDLPALRFLTQIENLQCVVVPSIGTLGRLDLDNLVDPLKRPAGTLWWNRMDRAWMVWVPAGEFTMGSRDEKPAHQVRLTRGYWLYRSPVTWGQYRAFCSAAQRKPPEMPEWEPADEHPVVNVSWEDACAYCEWAGARLPTEAEWEYAARGAEGRTYPWGEAEPSPELAVFGSGKGTEPVGSRPAGMSWCGAQDLAGNVWEWCADWFAAYESRGEPLIDPDGPSNGSLRVLRGSSWAYYLPRNLRAAYRGRDDPGYRNNNVGFRPARTG